MAMSCIECGVCDNGTKGDKCSYPSQRKVIPPKGKVTAKSRAEAHWDNYVGPMQKTLLDAMVETIQNISRFHYISSHVHGVKHAEEDMKNGASEKS